MQLIEAMAKNNKNIKTKRVKDKVLKNILEKYNDISEDKEYWSKELLIKLDLAPNPDQEGEDTEDRTEHLKDLVGGDVPDE